MNCRPVSCIWVHTIQSILNDILTEFSAHSITESIKLIEKQLKLIKETEGI